MRRMKSLRKSLAVLTAVAFATAPLTAYAQAAPAGTGAPSTSSSDDGLEEAAARYKRGTELYSEGNYSAALIEFKKAYELTNAYKVLYNIGQVCYQLQDYVCALSSFEDYLKRGGPQIAAKRKEEVDAEIKRLKPRIATVTIKSNVDGAEVTIDDVPRGKTPITGLLLSAGSHRMNVAMAGKLPITRVIEVAGATTPTIEVELLDAGGGTKEVIVHDVGERSKFTTLSYVGLGFGGALFAGGVVTGVLALGASSDLKDKNYVGDPSPEAKSLQTKVKTLRLTSDILLLAGIATLGTTLFLTLTRDPNAPAEAPPPKTSAVNLSFALGPGSAALLGEF
jgi:hypothetical protein